MQQQLRRISTTNRINFKKSQITDTFDSDLKCVSNAVYILLCSTIECYDLNEFDTRIFSFNSVPDQLRWPPIPCTTIS